ncbi:hypothetical protein Tco_0448609 [Tanacetum coccineum]
MRPFGYPVTILNTLDHLGKFDGKADEGFFVGYSTNSKAFRVFNSRTRIVKENMHVKFSEETPNIVGNGPNWLFDIDTLTKSMNYKPVVARNQTNGNAGTKENIDAGQAGKKTVSSQEYILLPLLTSDQSLSKGNEDSEVPSSKEPRINQEKDANVNSTNNINTASDGNNTNNVNTVSSTVNAVGLEDNDVDENIVYGCIDDPNMHNLEEIAYSDDDEEVGAEADMNNLAITMPVSPIPTTRVHKDHPLEQIIRDIHLAPQTRRMTKNVTEHVEPKKVIQALQDPSWIEAMQEELLQFKLQQVWTLMDLPHGKKAIGTKWIYKNKKDERGFEDPEFPDKVYKVEKALYGLHQAPRACQDKYVDEILKKFGFSTMKRASTPMETSKPLLKDAKAKDVDVHLCRSMIGSLMYLTASRPDIMFVVCACARFQVTPKVSHLHAVKRIFRYLKGQPKLGLWYPKDSPFDLEAYTDSDYAGASLDRKSTTGGCQFLGRRLISWQCKKQTIVANSTTKAEYVAASSCCGQVLWIQNQMLDYGYNFMNTKIFIDNESTICIVKNPMFHSKTKHIEIRHNFIKDSYEKRLIQVIKIHTDHNVADLLTKAFDNGTAAKDEIQVSVVRVTYYCLEAEQDSGNINRTQSMATLNEYLPHGIGSGSGPRVNTLRSGEDNMKLKDLMEFFTKLSVRALVM